MIELSQVGLFHNLIQANIEPDSKHFIIQCLNLSYSIFENSVKFWALVKYVQFWALHNSVQYRTKLFKLAKQIGSMPNHETFNFNKQDKIII